MVHIAIIMDGNGRWAKQRSLSRIEGHKAGLETFFKIALHAANLNINYFTVYAFSVQNWSRPITEIKGLFELANQCFTQLELFQKANIRLRIQGFIDIYPKATQQIIQNALEQTSANTGMVLTIALSYGGREEIVLAAEQLCKSKNTNQTLTTAIFEKEINPERIPSPDLIIRTSGEFRVSNFLLWQSAYSEYFIVETLWPDFTTTDFDTAVLSLSKRQRRYGGISIPEESKIPNFEDARCAFVRMLRDSSTLHSNDLTELKKYQTNTILRTKYFEKFKNVDSYLQYSDCKIIELICNRILSFCSDDILSNKTSITQWIKWIVFAGWLQEKYKITFTAYFDNFKTTNEPFQLVEMFRILKHYLVGPESETHLEMIKDHLFELSDEHRNIYMQFLSYTSTTDFITFIQGIYMCIYPLISHEFAMKNIIYCISFLFGIALYPNKSEINYLSCIEIALKELKDINIALVTKLKTAVIYYYLFSEKDNVFSLWKFINYINLVLE